MKSFFHSYLFQKPQPGGPLSMHKSPPDPIFLRPNLMVNYNSFIDIFIFSTICDIAPFFLKGSGKWGLRISLFSSSSAPSSSTNAIQYPSEHSSHITRRNVISLVESVNPEEGLPSPHRSDENSQDPLSTDDELSEGEDDQSYNVASGHPPPPPPPPVEYSLPQILSKQTNSVRMNVTSLDNPTLFSLTCYTPLFRDANIERQWQQVTVLRSMGKWREELGRR